MIGIVALCAQFFEGWEFYDGCVVYYTLFTLYSEVLSTLVCSLLLSIPLPLVSLLLPTLTLVCSILYSCLLSLASPLYTLVYSHCPSLSSHGIRLGSRDDAAQLVPQSPPRKRLPVGCPQAQAIGPPAPDRHSP